MEMNRYLIAALYVMAGCVVAVPLKVEGNSMPSERSAYRLLVNDTVKVISAYADVKAVDNVNIFGLSSDNEYFPKIVVYNRFFSFSKIILSEIDSVFPASNPIRAPEMSKK